MVPIEGNFWWWRSIVCIYLARFWLWRCVCFLDYPKVSRASTVYSSVSTYRDSSVSESTLRDSSASYVTINESQGQSIPNLADGFSYMNGNAKNGEVKYSAGELSEVRYQVYL